MVASMCGTAHSVRTEIRQDAPVVPTPEGAMTKTRVELDSMLDELDRDLQMLVMNDTGGDDLWQVFAGQADAIEASAGADDIAHVRSRMNDILATQGIAAPDAET